jgi:hypothetical protein
MDVIVTDDGVAFVQTPDGRLIEVGAVQKSTVKDPTSGEEVPVAVSSADLRKKAHGMLNPELLNTQKAEPFEGVDPADADKGRGVRDDFSAGGNTMSSLFGGEAKRAKATGGETQLDYMLDTTSLNPKYAQDNPAYDKGLVEDLRREVGLEAPKKDRGFAGAKKKLEELGEEG